MDAFVRNSGSPILTLGIGGVNLGIVYDGSVAEINLGDAYQDFVVDGTPDVVLAVCPGELPHLTYLERLFDADGIWHLDRIANGQLVFSCRTFSPDASSRFVAVIGRDLRSAINYLEDDPKSPELLRHLLPAPLGQVLLVSILSHGCGSLLHACGVIDQGQGILFAGTSGAGKSTLARLWGGRKDITVLSDDRIVVRKHEKRFWMYGTPWHGDAKAHSPQKAPLDRVFVVRHAAQNQCARLHSMEAVPALVVRSFSPLWDESGMEATLGLFAELTEVIPCYELGFVADESVIDFVRGISDELQEDESG